MKSSLRILVSWAIPPFFIPPIQLSSNQVTTCIKSNYQTPNDHDIIDIWTPSGHYDLAQLLKSKNLSLDFDLVLIFAEENNMPIHLGQFNCPKLLLVGDTHHKPDSILILSHYFKNEPFDFLALTYNLQHLHWFWELKQIPCAWFPGIIHRRLPFNTVSKKEKQCASVGKFYPHRKYLFERLQSKGFPVVAGKASRETSTKLYQSSLLSINISCNGDLNLRIFEILAAGGCLLTDKLSKQSGLYHLLEPDVDFITFDSENELLSIVANYFKYPSRVQKIVRSGYAKYLRFYQPESLKSQLLNWLFKHELKDPFTAKADQRFSFYQTFNPSQHHINRLEFYQKCLDLNRTRMNFKVVFFPEVHPMYIIDICDLSHAEIYLLHSKPEHLNIFQMAQIMDQIQFISENECQHINWELVVKGSNSISTALTTQQNIIIN